MSDGTKENAFKTLDEARGFFLMNSEGSCWVEKEIGDEAHRALIESYPEAEDFFSGREGEAAEPVQDYFRSTYRPLTEPELDRIKRMKAKANELAAIISELEGMGSPVELEHAMMNLRQAVMLGTFIITK